MVNGNWTPCGSRQKRPTRSFRCSPRGIGVRACERLSGLNRRTVLGILGTAGAKCESLLDRKLRNLAVGEVQVDELYSFVYCLQQNARPDDLNHGEQHTWLAVDRPSKLILGWLVGKRNKANAIEFLEDLKGRLASRIQLATDSWNPYFSAYGAVPEVFGKEIDYATELKGFGRTPGLGPDRRENPVILQWIKRTPRIGNPIMSRATTSHVERTNLSVCLFNRRYTRKTMGFSKKLRNLKFSVALLIAHFNFCRVHSAHGQTPAMAAGLTGHAWTIGELRNHGVNPVQ